jgi:protein involved in polysaccharide export with SLBB domain
MARNKFIICLAIFLCLPSGCGGKAVKPASLEAGPDISVFENILSHYYLQPGDRLDITFYQNPELNENVIVRPDGRISLQLIDELQVAGLTPQRVKELLTERYAPYLKNPMTSVSITSFGGQRVYVGGEVNSPGVITLKGRTTVPQAIIEAGGFKTDAAIKDVMVVSRAHDKSPLTRTVNVKKALKGKLPDEENLVKPFDIIYVPKSLMLKANEFIDQVYSFVPPFIWFGFSYEVHVEDD